MAIDASVPRTRRALLAGGLGGLAAVAASALGRPDAVRAGVDGDVVLGDANPETTTTSIQNLDNANVVLRCVSGAGDSIQAWTKGADRSAVSGNSQVAGGYGVFGQNTTSQNRGWLGASTFGAAGWGVGGNGVVGISDSGYGVKAVSSLGAGLLAVSTGHDGVRASTGAAGRSGVYGWAEHADGYGVFGRNLISGETGYLGFNGVGVGGQAKAGRAVNGVATSGVGLYGTASTGYALRTSGRLRVDKASGVATITAGNVSATVTPGLDVTSSSFVLLTPKADIGTRRLWYTTNTTTNTITIRVSSAVTAGLKVGWLLLG